MTASKTLLEENKLRRDLRKADKAHSEARDEYKKCRRNNREKGKSVYPDDRRTNRCKALHEGWGKSDYDLKLARHELDVFLFRKGILAKGEIRPHPDAPEGGIFPPGAQTGPAVPVTAGGRGQFAPSRQDAPTSEEVPVIEPTVPTAPSEPPVTDLLSVGPDFSAELPTEDTYDTEASAASSAQGMSATTKYALVGGVVLLLGGIGYLATRK